MLGNMREQVKVLVGLGHKLFTDTDGERSQ